MNLIKFLFILLFFFNFSKAEEEAPLKKDVVIKKEKKDISIKISNNLLKGNVYFGKSPTPVEFNNNSIELSLLTNKTKYSFSFDFLENNKSINISKLSTTIGYSSSLNNSLKYSLNIGAGILYYEENSPLQEVKQASFDFNSNLSLDYFITNSIFLSLNYKYTHMMFLDGFKYWGTNPRTDIVYDLNGFGIGFGWRFL